MVAGISSMRVSFMQCAGTDLLTYLRREELLDISQDSNIVQCGKVDGNTFSAESTRTTDSV